MGLLDGKVAVVTGAGSGIGRAHAELLAAEGAHVVVNDISSADEAVAAIEHAGGVAVASGHDIGRWDEAEALVGQAIEVFGDLDIVVNNAGIVRDRTTWNMTEDEWDAVVRVHLKGHMGTSRAAAAYWRGRVKAGEPVAGRIINTSSEAGLFNNFGQSNYAAAKAAIASLTVVLARELERSNVTVNAIAPRARTSMTDGLFDMEPIDGFDAWDPANISPVVAWLASDLASDITGQVFVVFGGDVYVLGGFHVEGEIHATQRWTIEQLDAHKGELFARRASGMTPFEIAGEGSNTLRA
jgi:NAD(P)-dependent dehydrogenase (short-subunit alcohol dehydrogenase family)